MSRLLSLALIGMLLFSPLSLAEDAMQNRWIIKEQDDPFSGQTKLSVHVEFKTTDSRTNLPLFASFDIARQPNPHAAVAALGLISHYSPHKTEPIESPARIIRLSVDEQAEFSIPAYYQTDMGSAFGTRHWYLVDLDCAVLNQLATGQLLSIDTPEDSIIRLSGASTALSQVVPKCFPTGNHQRSPENL